MASRSKFHCLIVCSALLAAGVADVRAQGVADFEVPDRSKQVRASCNNTDLPLDGYDIAEQIPNSNECWWVKAADAQEPRSDVDPGMVSGVSTSGQDGGILDEEATVEEAFTSARRRYQAALAKVNAQRREAQRTYLQASSTCGANIGCHYQAYSALQKRNAQLRAMEQKATAELKRDLDWIDDYYFQRDGD